MIVFVTVILEEKKSGVIFEKKRNNVKRGTLHLTLFRAPSINTPRTINYWRPVLDLHLRWFSRNV